MTYKLSYDLCQAFRDTNLAELGSLPLLNVRLGLEQIQDTPEFRPAAEERWALPIGQRPVPGPEAAILNFQNVSPQNAGLDAEVVIEGFNAVVDLPEFQESCVARWAAWEANPWPRPGEEEIVNEVDLGAMPSDEHMHPMEA